MGIKPTTILAAALLLSACSAATNQKILAGVQTAEAVTLQVEQSACAAVSYASMAFDVAASGPLKSQISAADVTEKARWLARIDEICKKAPADTQAAYNFLLQALAAINSYQTGQTVPPAPATLPAGAVVPAS